MKNTNIFAPYAGLFLRVALGVVFIYHGYGKVFGETAGMGTAWMGGNNALPMVIQVLVSWGEFLGGLALLVGLFTRYAAVGIILIMAGAIVTVHGQNGFGMKGGGYEYNFVLIMMCLALLASGPGKFAVDNK